MPVTKGDGGMQTWKMYAREASLDDISMLIINVIRRERIGKYLGRQSDLSDSRG